MIVAAAVLVIHGTISPALVRDPPAWRRARETFIRETAQRLAPLHPRLPVTYRLDDDFVAAAKGRGSVDVVDDCGDNLCGVATDELPQWWPLADVRALVTPSGAPRRERDAFAAAITGWFGDDVDAVAADLLRVFTKWSDVANEEDELIYVPVAASLIRALDPQHRMSFAAMRERLEHLSAADEQRWLAGLRRRRVENGGVAAALRIRGATFSIVNRPERSTIATASRAQLEHVRAIGFGAISLIPFAAQRGADATELRRLAGSPSTETDLAILLAAARAHRLGMRVMLKPHVWVWPGGDATRIDAGAQWPRWFASYERFVTHEALLARAAGAEWLCVGTELTRSESRPEWRRVISRVRALYHGAITYAANFDQFERTPFWRELDAVGIDAYFPLSPKSDATDAELRAGARAIVARLDAVARAAGKPLILTELGYASTRAPWVTPWTESRGEPEAPHDQARAFAAMLEAVGGRPFFIWKYESDRAVSERPRFHVQGKESEGVIARHLR